MSSIVVAGDTSGSVTISAPAVAGTPTLTLPTTSGTIVTSANINSYVTTPPTMKNRIINGAMNVWQRGTSFSASGGGYYTADRWQNFSQTYTASRSTDVPTGLAQYSLDINGNAGSYGTVMQRIEAANCADLVGQSVTVSVYVKAVSGGTNGLVCVLDYATVADNFTSQTNIGSVTMASTVSGSWTRYTATFNSLPSGAANGLQVFFYNNSVAANQYRYTLAQLEVGSSATSFEWRPYGMELALCQRYFYKVNADATYGTNRFGSVFFPTTTIAAGIIQFPVTMRTFPTGSYSSLSDWTISAAVGTLSVSAMSLNTVPFNGEIDFTVSGATAGQGGQIRANTNTASISFSAEL